jgi:signal recognition particle subunit SEC65
MPVWAPTTPKFAGSARRRQEAVAPEGHRPCAPGFHPRAELGRRWHRLRPDAAQVHEGAAQEDAAACAAQRAFVEGGGRQNRRVDRLAIEQPKTKTVVNMLSALGLQEQSVLLVVAEKTVPVWKSTNNLPEVKTMLSGYINVRDLLSHDVLLLTQDAVEAHIEDWLAPTWPSKSMTPRLRKRRRRNHARLRSSQATHRDRKDDDRHRRTITRSPLKSICAPTRSWSSRLWRCLQGRRDGCRIPGDAGQDHARGKGYASARPSGKRQSCPWPPASSIQLFEGV